MAQDASKPAFSRSSLIIFVDEPGRNIFKKFDEIKKEIGLVQPQQKHIELIFYRLDLKRACLTSYERGLPDIKNPKKYTTVLDTALRNALKKLRNAANGVLSPQ